MMLRRGHDLDLRVFACPRSLRRELPLIFPECPPDSTVTLVILVLKASCDLLAMTPETHAEKDRLLLQSTRVGEYILSECTGYWVDWVDPCSGLPVKSSRCGPAGYNEVQGLELLWKMPIVQVGACKVAMHDQWKGSIYPVTVFTTAPKPVLDRVLAARYY